MQFLAIICISTVIVAFKITNLGYLTNACDRAINFTDFGTLHNTVGLKLSKLSPFY